MTTPRLQKLIEVLRRRRHPNMPPMIRPFQPIAFGPNGEADAPENTVRRLEHLQSLAALAREQLEAIEVECCELLGADPEAATIESDWAREIAGFGTDVMVVIERLSSRMAESVSA